MNINIYNPYVRRELELYHHGINGQKWGVRNGPPYPLGEGDHSAREEKAGWRDSVDKSGSGIDKEKLKKAAKIGAIVAGTALVAVGGYYLYKSGALTPLIERGKSIFQGSSGSSVGSYDISKVNPDFNSGLEHQMNCGNCVITNEMMHRGITDITAGQNKTGMTIAQLSSYFKGLKSESFYEPEMHMLDVTKLPDDLTSVNPFKLDRLITKRGHEISNFLKDGLANQFPKGSRGCMMVPTAQGSHWISWTIDNAGKVAFENPQYPKFPLEKWLGTYKYAPKMSSAQLTAIRLDNLDVDNSRIGEVVNIGDKVTGLFETASTSGNNFVMTDPQLAKMLKWRMSMT